MANKIESELWVGTSTKFFKWGENFESVSAAKKYVRECITCYYEIRPRVYKIGLKANSAFLFEQTKGKNLGGTYSDKDIYHSKTILLNSAQFENFKEIIKRFGFSLERSLVVDSMGDCDYSCSVSK